MSAPASLTLPDAEVARVLAGAQTELRQPLDPQPDAHGDNYSYGHVWDGVRVGTLKGIAPTTLVGRRGWDAQYHLDNPRYIGKCPLGEAGYSLAIRGSIDGIRNHLWLQIISVRAERLQDIDEAGALACGGWRYTNCPIHKAPVRSFAELWDSTHDDEHPWASNPWAWALRFRLVSTTGKPVEVE